MKITRFYAIALIFAVVACTKEKTDYEAEISTVVTEYEEFKEAATFQEGDYSVSIQALNGTFYKGYNEIRVNITNLQTKEDENASEVNFLPLLMSNNDEQSSCPHRYDLLRNEEGKYFSGYTVFTSESGTDENWEVYLRFTINNRTYSVKHAISVQEQTNKNLNMTTFTGKDDEQYIIALVGPQKPKVAENELIAGIYKFNKPINSPSASFPDPSQFSYSEVKGYTLQLDPRMPEPSMGNHSSPNNVDLTQHDDGLYYGVVNYTMTGNWTLNFILLNQDGQILKGTEVPTDFTPGVEGAKSELHIDILF